MSSLSLLTAAMLLCFSSCSAPEQLKEYEGYVLTAAELDGEVLEVSSIYPVGASLRLYEDGTGRITLGEMSCIVSWSREGDDISITINGLNASGTENSGTMRLSMGDTGLVYEFSEGEMESAENESTTENALQQLWNGSWKGRLYFSNTGGEWLEYDSRSMEANAEISIGQEGTGTVEISNSAYSGDIPMMRFGIDLSSSKPHSNEGFLMGFPLREGDVTISLVYENPDDIESTVVIHPEEFNWYVPELGIFEQEEPEPVQVLRLSGGCADASGNFDYMIVLQR